jgi:uncharacterized protein
LNSAIYAGKVAHRRFFPREHRFTYGVYYLYLDLGELVELDRSVPGFGHNRAAPFAFHDRDHGPRDGSPLRPWLDAHLREAGIDLEGGPVRILTLPRILGHVFNPISVWFGFGPGGDLRMVLYEVSNTFGQWHHYLCAVDGLDAAGNARHRFDKELFVSPFIDMDATYEFRARSPDERAALVVREYLPAGHVLTATLVARRRAMTGGNLWRMFATHPMMTLKVVGGIHWEALRLWRKGAPFRRHGAAPEHGLTIERGADRSPAPSARLVSAGSSTMEAGARVEVAT